MKYAEFREKVKNYPFFRSHIFEHLTGKPLILRRQLVDWLKKGSVVQLKRGMYTLRQEDRSSHFSELYLANNLYAPSYISLETALSYYQLIPERVNATLSITTKKTQHFQNSFGYFSYRHIKQSLFENFIMKQDEFNNIFFIATPEKAVVDFLYFKSKEITTISDDVFELSFRFQNLDTLNAGELKRIARNFKQKKLLKLIDLLIKQMGREK
jgi:hypothetical protein